MARTPTKPPPGVELSQVLAIRGNVAAHEWITQTLGVPVKLNYVRTASKQRQIPCVKIGHALHFSTQDLFDWVMSLTDRKEDQTA